MNRIKIFKFYDPNENDMDERIDTWITKNNADVIHMSTTSSESSCGYPLIFVSLLYKEAKQTDELGQLLS